MNIVDIKQPKRNAVIFELIDTYDDRGNPIIKPVIHIECKDKELLQVLKDEADRLFSRH